jgi:hypothetical protein
MDLAGQRDKDMRMLYTYMHYTAHVNGILFLPPSVRGGAGRPVLSTSPAAPPLCIPHAHVQYMCMYM